MPNPRTITVLDGLDVPRVISTLDAVLDSVGGSGDDIVAAGGTGSIQSKLKRLSSDLNTALSLLSGLGGTGGGGIVGGTLADLSGVVASGGTAQELVAANPSRVYLLFQNTSTSDLWIDFGTDAVGSQPSIQLVSGASFESSVFVSTQSVSVYGGTTGQAYTAKEGTP